MRIPDYLPSFVGLLLLSAVPTFAEEKPAKDAYHTIAVRLETPRKKPPVIGDPALETVEYSLWIPAEARPVRGLIFNPFSPTSKEVPPLKHWHEACRLWRFAYLTANYDGVNRKEFAATFRAALAEFAERSKRPELIAAPFCAIGMSRGGGYSRAFALEFPDRAIAVAPVCLESPPDEPLLRSIPFLTVFGEKDGGQMQKILTAHPLRRGEGARWAIAVQWGRAHEFALANNIAIPFFDAVIRRRVPEAAGSGSHDAPTKPVDYPAEPVWLGDVGAWREKRHAAVIAAEADFAGDRTTAAWLPDRRTAHAWRAFVSTDKSVQIVEPPGLGDKQPFAAHAPHRPVKVRIESTSQATKKIAIYDGDVLLGERNAVEAEFSPSLQPGFHPIYAVTEEADGTPRYSRVHTLVVREK